MRTVFITGANRGLGFEFARQYAKAGWEVIATCRNPDAAGELNNLGVEVMALDVADVTSCQDIAKRLAGRKIDVLLNNAGMMGNRDQSILSADIAEWNLALQTNTIAPAALAGALLENLKKSEKPVGVTIGSLAGIYCNMDPAKRFYYQSSKAGAHAVTIALGEAMKAHGVIYASLRPGQTKTDMAGPEAMYEVEDSVTLMRTVINNLTMASAGKFVDRGGAEVSYDTGKLTEI